MTKKRTLDDLEKIAKQIQDILFAENLTDTETLYVLSFLQGGLIGTTIQSRLLEKLRHYGISG